MKTSTPDTDAYTIEDVSVVTVEIFCKVAEIGEEQSKLYDMYDWSNFDPGRYISRGGRLTICRRGREIVGAMIARLQPSIFDFETMVLVQDLLWAKPGTRAAKFLLDDFIDFGKSRADHIVTMIAQNSNIKPRSLERLGFKKADQNFIMEIK